MKQIWAKIKKAWLFNIANPVVRKGEEGGFKWVFRRYTLDISSVSGNFKVRFTADLHPYGYLLAGEDTQTHGFSQLLYQVGKLLTTEQKFVDDVKQALNDYDQRLFKAEKEESGLSEEIEEAVAIEEVKQIEKAAKKRDPKTGRFVKAE